MDTPSLESAERICVHLLDTSSGAIVQTWQFLEGKTVAIGRSVEADVRVGDQLVSRLHAELRRIDGVWTIVSQGRNGLVIDNQRVERAALKDRTVFRLGPNGPMLSFRFGRAATDSMATLDETTVPVVQLRIDEAQKARDVEEIVGGDYFHTLREKAARLRARS